MSQRIAYVKWQPVTQQDAKYTVEVVSSGKEEEKEATLETETKTNEFVARELEGDKEYTMTISAKSSEGDIIATGTHSIPLPKNENVPTPQGVRVTGATKSLRVKWDVSPAVFYSIIILKSLVSPCVGGSTTIWCGRIFGHLLSYS